MSFAAINGIVLHYEDLGSTALPTIVFSNSLGTDFRIWDGVVRILRPEFRLIRYDKRGHGLSEAPAAPYAMADHVGDLAGLLDEIGVEDTLVVGLSVGGMIAQGLAAERPELTHALVLCDTAHKIGTDALWNERIAAVEADGIASIADGVLQRWFSEAYRTGHRTEFAGYRHMLTRTPADGYVGTCAAIRDTDLTESTRHLGLPALCVVGDEDGSTPPDVVGSLAELLPEGRLEVVAGSGHLPCIDQPRVLAGLIRAFAKEVGLV